MEFLIIVSGKEKNWHDAQDLGFVVQKCQEMFSHPGVSIKGPSKGDRSLFWELTFAAKDCGGFTIECDPTERKIRQSEVVSRLREKLCKSMKLLGQSFDLNIIEAFRLKAQKRLVVFDMDSTLISQECINEMARLVGVSEKVSEITESAMRGELDFTQSLKARCSLLKSANAKDVYDHVKSIIRFNAGVEETCSRLKEAGFYLVVVSGGFMPLAEYVRDRLGLHECYANRLEIDCEGHFTGNLKGPIVDAAMKNHVLQTLLIRHGFDFGEAVCVGDGANDLYMIHGGAYGIAYRAKPIVQENSHISVSEFTHVADIIQFEGKTNKCFV